MPRDPSTTAREKAAKVKRDLRDSAIARIRRHAEQIRDQISGDPKNKLIKNHREIWTACGVKRSTYFRYLKGDKELRDLVSTIIEDHTSSFDRRPNEQIFEAGSTNQSTDRTNDQHSEIITLKQQISSCRLLISSFEMERASNDKKIKSKDLTISELRHKISVLVDRLNCATRFLHSVGHSDLDVFGAADAGASLNTNPPAPNLTPSVARPDEGRRHLKAVRDVDESDH